MDPSRSRAAAVAAVDYPERTLSLIMAKHADRSGPQSSTVVRRVEESIGHGAFKCHQQPCPQVHREHGARHRSAGSAAVLDLDPDDPIGLRGHRPFRRSPEGDQALNDAADDLLGASIGMAVAPTGEKDRH